MSVACQFCGSSNHMSRVLSLGYMPPPNDMPVAKLHIPKPQQWLPTELWFCDDCELAQLGYVPNPTVAFPDDYPYTSGATPALRENFEDLADKCNDLLKLTANDLVVDIGSNDGTLLDCFIDQVGTRILGIEPTAAAYIARENKIPTEKLFFDSVVATSIRARYGKAKLITCANCFAHMPNIHDVVEGIKLLLADDGMFVSESHYLIDLIDTLQYDTIYAEHLRYYSIRSISKLLNGHGFRVAKIERIPTHGGSIRVYATKSLLASIPIDEPHALQDRLLKFAAKVQFNRGAVRAYLHQVASRGGWVAGIGAPSRGSTVINYLGLDKSIVRYVAEQPHSLKLGRLMPGTDIPVVDEKQLYEDQPDAAILFSWHLASRLVPKLRKQGYKGEIVLPCSAKVIGLAESNV